MAEILSREELTSGVYRMRVKTPDIARSRKAGQFVILRVTEGGERFPLTIADADEESISIIFNAVGNSTRALAALQPGDDLLNIVGPLGKPTEIHSGGRVICIGGGIGVAPLYPITTALKAAGNHVTSIIGSRTKDLLILEDEMRDASDHLEVTTDDGSYGFHGFVTQVLDNILSDNTSSIQQAYAIGPVPMMKAVCGVTSKYSVPTLVSLNPIMVDGTGMCGGCRVTVGGETKFACVDGPEFDGHKVDFDGLQRRLGMYVEHEAGKDCRMERADR